MKNSKIELVDKVSDEIEEKMRKDLIEYEARHAIDVNYKPFSLILRDEKNNVMGVLNAFTAFSEIYINDIWVDSVCRRKGYGRQLIQALEERFKGKGFNNMNLCTSAFQAPEFYQKCGFEVEFVRINKKNRKLTKTFFVKYFDDEIQTQGILDSTRGKINDR